MDKGFPEFGAALKATGRWDKHSTVQFYITSYTFRSPSLKLYQKMYSLLWCNILSISSDRNMVYQCEWPLYQGGHGITPNYTGTTNSTVVHKTFNFQILNLASKKARGLLFLSFNFKNIAKGSKARLCTIVQNEQ